MFLKSTQRIICAKSIVSLSYDHVGFILDSVNMGQRILTQVQNKGWKSWVKVTFRPWCRSRLDLDLDSRRFLNLYYLDLATDLDKYHINHVFP